MYRFKFSPSEEVSGIRYGVMQAEALASGLLPNSVYFASENKLYLVAVNISEILFLVSCPLSMKARSLKQTGSRPFPRHRYGV